MTDYFFYVLKAGAVLGIVMVSTMASIFATDAATTVIGGAVTLVGLAGLLWKLVTDHKVETEQADRWKSMLDRADKRIAALEKENQELRMENHLLRTEDN